MKKITNIDKLMNLNVHGTQPKWKIGTTWYKADDFNHEGLAETIVSDMLQKSNVRRYAVYEPELIQYNSKVVIGCKSEHFLKPEEKLIEATTLFDLYGKGDAIKDDTESIKDPEQTIKEFLSTIKDITGLTEFDWYLTMMFELDKIILNPDRHFGNITVIKTDKGFDYAPFFDQGRAFALCDDLWDRKKSVDEIIASVDSRPFSGIFSRQTDILESITQKDILEINYSLTDLKHTLDKCADTYPDEILNRAEAVFRIQLEKNLRYFIGEEMDTRLNTIMSSIDKKFHHPCQCEKRHKDILIIPDDKNGIHFCISVDKDIQVLKDGIILADEDLILNYNDSLQIYKDLYHAMEDEALIDMGINR